jgi:acetylglutamate kinase
VPGLLEDVTRPTSLVPYTGVEDLDALELNGKVSGGMRPKLAAVRRALGRGVASAHLVSGVTPEAVLTEVFTNQGSGTMVVREARAKDCAA